MSEVQRKASQADFWSYKTSRQLMIKDKLLGVPYILCCCLAVFYLFQYHILQFKLDIVSRKGFGHVNFKPLGKAYYQDGLAADWGDYSNTNLIQDSLFIATSLTQIDLQRIGFCGPKCKEEDPLKYCVFDPPIRQPICTNNLCQYQAWCPNLYQEFPEIFLENFNDLRIYFIATFSASNNINKIWKSSQTFQNVQYPDPGYNTLRLYDLVFAATHHMYDPQNPEDSYERVFSQLQREGATFEIDFQWDCQSIQNECQPSLTSKYLNTSSFYNPTYKRGVVYFEESSFQFKNSRGQIFRNYYFKKGFKFYFTSSGMVHEKSLLKWLVQIGISLLLFEIIKNIEDFLILTLSNKYNKKNFWKGKYQNSADFSDLQAGLNQLKKENQMLLEKLDEEENNNN